MYNNNYQIKFTPRDEDGNPLDTLEGYLIDVKQKSRIPKEDPSDPTASDNVKLTFALTTTQNIPTHTTTVVRTDTNLNGTDTHNPYPIPGTIDGTLSGKIPEMYLVGICVERTNEAKIYEVELADIVFIKETEHVR